MIPDPVTILDGPVGTELLRRGVDCSGPLWSASSIDAAPEVLALVHREYAEAGATVHTAATFRTQPSIEPRDWERLARRAVRIARDAVPRGHRVAGSLAPLADCYRPDLSPAPTDPAGTQAAHLALATVLADAGCDILLCETFCHTGEALLAARAAVDAAGATGAEVWLSFSPGFAGNLLRPEEVRAAAEEAARIGVGAVLVNCAPFHATLPFVRAIAAGVWGRGVAVGAYANAGPTEHDAGLAPERSARYVEAAQAWRLAGARIVGACCGGDAALIRSLTQAFEA